MSEAGLYRCPSCGAPAGPHAAACGFCRAQLHPVRCPWCFDWTDATSRDCPRCGAVGAPPAVGAKPLNCPACGKAALFSRGLGGVNLSSCADCGGVWADAVSFKKLCEDRAAQSAYMGEGSALERPKASDPSKEDIRYRPCPSCGELMNRFNFAGCSGVILDVCKPHGVWFDADELRRIVEFIRGGGLDVARAKEKTALELERRRLEQAANDIQRPMTGFSPPVPEHITSAAGLLGALLGLDEKL
jgi:Zn-finger nucleic acid-binding protein